MQRVQQKGIFRQYRSTRLITRGTSGVACQAVTLRAPKGRVYYFAFGANLSPAVLSRRKLDPAASYPGTIHNYKLKFHHVGGVCIAAPVALSTATSAPERYTMMAGTQRQNQECALVFLLWYYPVYSSEQEENGWCQMGLAREMTISSERAACTHEPLGRDMVG